MKQTESRKRIYSKAWLAPVLLTAIAVFAIAIVNPVMAGKGKPDCLNHPEDERCKDKGGDSIDAPSPYNLVRASFASPSYLGVTSGGIFADGLHTCTYNGSTYDYWAWQERFFIGEADSMLDYGVGTNNQIGCESPENRSDASGGGRWFLMTSAGEVRQNHVIRWLVVDFSEQVVNDLPVNDPSLCPDLDWGGNDNLFWDGEGGPSTPLDIEPIYFGLGDADFYHLGRNDNPCVDHLTVRLAADRILKNKANLQQLGLTIRHRPNGSDYWIPWGHIMHTHPLFLRDPEQGDVDFYGTGCSKVMSTRPAWNAQHVAQEAELFMSTSPSSEVLVGTYNLPMEVCVIRASE